MLLSGGLGRRREPSTRRLTISKVAPASVRTKSVLWSTSTTLPRARTERGQPRRALRRPRKPPLASSHALADGRATLTTFTPLCAITARSGTGRSAPRAAGNRPAPCAPRFLARGRRLRWTLATRVRSLERSPRAPASSPPSLRRSLPCSRRPRSSSRARRCSARIVGAARALATLRPAASARPA